MANVPLRTYVNEIESIIEQKQTEEAIAHCRHILQTYPKNIDTYRMLGKAYLESQRYSNAADIFQRVLSALPDDFVSHVGMSIIREDEKNLDAAIWHMERAFEGQPYNAAIQGELRRLFGLRDGMEPPKVHLTRGALARMYVKGNLHQQAIAELRAAIAEDPQRFDLQVSLAQMYVQNGQTAKAIDTCGTIISKLPYCLDANYILAQLLETTDRSEEVEAYRKRVQELDPYHAYIGPNAPTVDRVPVQAVMVEQLIWDGGPAIATSDQPEWAASVGVSLEDSRAVDEGLPDWMSDSSDEAPALPASLDGVAEPEDEDIPDFMKDAGWGPSTGAFDESQSAFDLDEEDAALETSEAVAGDIPDWLQQMAPPEEADSTDEAVEAPDEAIPSEKDDSLDWLQEAGSESEDEDGGIPDWLAPAAMAGATGAVALISTDDEPSEPEEAPVDGDVPDWLQELDGEGESPGGVESKEAELPDWLQETVDEDVELPESTPEAKESGVTDWLQEMTDDEEAAPEPVAESEPVEAEEAAPEPVAEGESAEAEDGEIPDWLAPAAGAAVAASLISSDDEKAEPAEAEETEIPDWLQDSIKEDEATPVVEIESSEAEEEAAPEPVVEGKPVDAEETDIPDWLQESAEEDDAVAEVEPVKSAEAEEIEIPDWLQESIDEDEATPVVEIEPSEAEEEAAPEPVAEIEADEVVEAEPVEAEETEIPDWLQESIDEDEATPDAELAVDEAEEATPEPVAESEPIEAEDDALPDWLAPAAGVVAAASILPSDEEKVELEEAEETEIPDWLQESIEEDKATPVAEIEADEVVEAEPVEAKEIEIPDWLQESIDEDEAILDAEIELSEAEEDAPEPVVEGEPVDAEDESLPEWLQESAEADEAAPIEKIEPAEAEETEIPDWLQDSIDEDKATPVAEIVSDQAEEAAPEPVAESESAETEDGETPDWLAPAAGTAVAASILSSDDETEDPVEAEETELPDWLQETTEEEITPVAEIESIVIEETETPDWLQEMGDDEETVSEPTPEGTPVETEDGETPDWLAPAAGAAVAASILPSDDETEGPVEAEETELPDWLQETTEEEITPVAEIESIVTEETETPDWLQEMAEGKSAETEDGEIPDWLAPAAGAAIAASILSSDEEKVELDEAEETDIPDWLQETTEEDEVAPVAEIESTEVEEVEIPDWLQETGGDEETSLEPTAEVETVEAVPELVAEIVPDEVDEAEIVSAESVVEAEPVDAEAGEIPDWLQEAVDDELPEPESDIEPADSEGTEIPDWLQEAIDEEVPESIAETESLEPEIPELIQEVADEETPEPTTETDGGQLPDTLKAVGAIEAVAAGIAAIAADDAESQTEESVEIPVADIPSDGMDLSGDTDDADAAMAWVESLAAKKGVSEDELLTSPEERSETPPDWVQEVVDDQPALTEPAMVEPDESVETPAAEEDETLEIVSTQEIDDQPEDDTSEIITDDLPDWLQEIPAEPSSPGSESEEAKIEDEIIPDWLQDISDEIPAIAGESEIEAETQAEPAIEDIPEWLQDIAEEQIPEVKEEPESEKLETPDFEDADAAMAWMESLAAKQGVSEDELLTSPEERSETPPDWVQDIASTEAASILEIETIADDETLEGDETVDIPDWLSEPIEVDEIPESDVEAVLPATEIQDEDPPALDLPEFLQEPITTETDESEIELTDAPESIAETDDAVELEEISADDDIVAPDFEDADAAMAWLESLAAKQGVSEDELLTSPKERRETPPDWVQDAVQSNDTQAEDEELATLDEIPSVEGDIPDWILDAPETKEPADSPEIVSDAIEVEEPLLVQEETPLVEIEIPDWILDAPETEELAAKPEMIAEATDEAPEIVEVSTSDIDAALTGDEGAVPDFEDADAAMAWLESLAAKQGVSEDDLLTSPDERSDTPTDWVQDAIETEKITQVDDLLVEEEPSIEAEDLSDWLAKLGATQEYLRLRVQLVFLLQSQILRR